MPQAKAISRKQSCCRHDPLRAKFIAENFLENFRLYNEVRECWDTPVPL